MNTQKKVKGFTIIEVVLVLAIAGLIFLMVFIALPSLQRSQRDTQRKSDVSRVMTQISSYSANNRGKIPDNLITGGSGTGTAANSFVQNYLEGVSASEAGLGYSDPKTGSGYIFSIDENVDEAKQIGYVKGKLCGDDGSLASGSGRQYAIFIFLESQKAPYCVDNR